MRHRFIQDLYGRSFDSPASIQPHVDIGLRREAERWADGHCVGKRVDDDFCSQKKRC